MSTIVLDCYRGFRFRVLPLAKALNTHTWLLRSGELSNRNSRPFSVVGSKSQGCVLRVGESAVLASDGAERCSDQISCLDAWKSAPVSGSRATGRGFGREFQLYREDLKLQSACQPGSTLVVLDNSVDRRARSVRRMSSLMEEDASPSTAAVASTEPGLSECEGGKLSNQTHCGLRGANASHGSTVGINECVREGGVKISTSAESDGIMNHEDHYSEEQQGKLSKLATVASQVDGYRIFETATDGSLQCAQTLVALHEEGFPARPDATTEGVALTSDPEPLEGDSDFFNRNSGLSSPTSSCHRDSKPHAHVTTIAFESEELEKSQENAGENLSSADRSLKPDDAGLYPVPISPLPGAAAKAIELERAMAAETKMRSGPAITRDEVLYEDEFFLAVTKPCGVYSEHVLQTVSELLLTSKDAQATESFLSRLTLRHASDRKQISGLHLHMANRLDRDTSGVMIITKCREAAKQFSNIFTRRHVHKSYIALCRGSRPSWTSLTIESGHGRSRHGTWRVYARKDVSRSLPGGSVVRDMTTKLMVVAVNHEPVSDQRICSSAPHGGDEVPDSVFQVEEVATNLADRSAFDRRGSAGGDEVVIRAVPKTGRTHQIRLHCQMVGLPLRGDVKYGDQTHAGVTYDHHALHAESLSFRHPFTFEEMHFVAPLPQWAVEAGVQGSL